LRHAFLTSALEEGEWSASHPGHLTPGETTPVNDWRGRRVGPTAGLDAVEKRKIPRPRQKSNPPNPDRPVPSQLLYRLTYPYVYHHHREFKSRQGLGIFLLTTASRPALGPTQPPIQWVPTLSLRVKRPGSKADHLPPPSAEVKNAWSSVKAQGELYILKKSTCKTEKETGR
jgi:hypothetical protein